LHGTRHSYRYHGKPLNQVQKTELIKSFDNFMQSLVPAQEQIDYIPEMTNIKLEGSKPPKKNTGQKTYDAVAKLLEH
jgi:hypothetical protein